MFFRGSRYERVPESVIDGRAGRVLRYKRLRLIPAVEGTLTDTVREGERPDLLAYRVLGDPEQFWRLCDANRVRRPADLTAVPGRRVRVPGPGVGG